MCIVCEMKKAVSSASPEVKKAVVDLAEKMGHSMVDILNVARAAESRLSASNALSSDEEEALTKAEDLIFGSSRNPLADALAAIFGGITVTTINVEIEEGESISDAIARTLKDNDASSSAFTKH